MTDSAAPETARALSQAGSDGACSHLLVHAMVFAEGEHEGEVALWTCDFCRLRFYPAEAAAAAVSAREGELRAALERDHGLPREAPHAGHDGGYCEACRLLSEKPEADR